MYRSVMEVQAYENVEILFSTDYISNQSCILADSDNNQHPCVTDRSVKLFIRHLYICYMLK